MNTFFIKLLSIFSLLVILSACTTNYTKPYKELSDPNHEEIASVRHLPWNSYTVVYNPITCELIGDACAFFRAHAYAHYVLNHALLPPEFYPAISEKQADCYVAKHGKQNEIKAAVDLMLDNNRGPNLKIQGDPLIRAQNIIDCAKQAGNWSDN
ncbi:MAG: hypothetical protein DHS20C09_15700 [marine bacterium B5-7]|nr:MAG: hypothetical protein DHS20C09_15700 [marine bacterium B5-7]